MQERKDIKGNNNNNNNMLKRTMTLIIGIIIGIFIVFDATILYLWLTNIFNYFYLVLLIVGVVVAIYLYFRV